MDPTTQSAEIDVSAWRENREPGWHRDVGYAFENALSQHHYDTASKGSKPDDPGWHECSCGWEGYWCDFHPHVADHLRARVYRPGLPTDEDGDIITSTSFGHAPLVKIEWNTDFDGREIDPGKEEYPYTLHGPFADKEEAAAWMEAYPDDTDIHDIVSITLNLVKP